MKVFGPCASQVEVKLTGTKYAAGKISAIEVTFWGLKQRWSSDGGRWMGEMGRGGRGRVDRWRRF